MKVDKLHREGYFTRFGIINFMAWKVAQVCDICDRNGWIKPSVYQGVYNTPHRFVEPEPEPFPCLRRHGMVFYSYNPLAGGYLTSRYHCENKADEVEKGSCCTRYSEACGKEAWLDGSGVCIEMDDTSFDVEEGVWRCCDYWGVKHEASRRELG